MDALAKLSSKVANVGYENIVKTKQMQFIVKIHKINILYVVKKSII